MSGCVQSFGISADAQFCSSPHSAVDRSTEEAKEDVAVCLSPSGKRVDEGSASAGRTEALDRVLLFYFAVYSANADRWIETTASDTSLPLYSLRQPNS